VTKHTAYLTGQRRLKLSDVNACLHRDADGTVRLTAAIDAAALAAYAPDSRVVVEPYARGRATVQSLGTAGSPAPITDLDVTQGFPDPADVLFRFVVLDPASARIVAARDRVAPTIVDNANTGQSRGEGILLVDVGELDGLAWELRVDEIPAPTLVVDRAIVDAYGNRSTWLRDPAVVAYVLPEVCRRVLTWAAAEDRDAGGAAAQWLRFAVDLAPTEDIPPIDADDDDVAVWAEDVARRFAQTHDVVSALVNDQENNA
jgi:hypothetical protein